MTMPVDLVLLRHGESEGNEAVSRSRKGDDSLFTEDFLNRHNSTWHLTTKGIGQAVIAGKWIRKNIGQYFDRYYVSEHVRALQTAHFLNLPGADWRPNLYLRERDWGQLDVMSHQQRLAEFSKELFRRERDGFYWAPPGGESMAHLCLRIDRVIDTLHRECSDKKVLIVCHGEVMWAFRVRLERLSQSKYYELDSSKSFYDKIHNCQVIHYTRKNPKTNRLDNYPNWFRSVCTSDLKLSNNDWQEINRSTYSNEDLLKEIQKLSR